MRPTATACQVNEPGTNASRAPTCSPPIQSMGAHAMPADSGRFVEVVVMGARDPGRDSSGDCPMSATWLANRPDAGYESGRSACRRLPDDAFRERVESGAAGHSRQLKYSRKLTRI